MIKKLSTMYFKRNTVDILITISIWGLRVLILIALTLLINLENLITMLK